MAPRTTPTVRTPWSTGGGWTITLNIDRKKQTALEQAVKGQLTSKLDAKKRKVDGNVQAGAASVDPKTGRVLALYGGTDYFKHYISNATRRDYQPASTFKPIILAAAMEKKARTQDGDLIDPNTVYDGTSGGRSWTTARRSASARRTRTTRTTATSPSRPR